MLPTAQTMPVAKALGVKMTSWFNIFSTDIDGVQDEKGIRAAFRLVNDIITREVERGTPADRIVLGGFSQGGAVALFTALNTEHKLAGVVALSTFLPLHKQLEQSADSNKDTPVFMAHGDSDMVVSYKWGSLSVKLLRGHFQNLTFITYPGLGHQTIPTEMVDIKEFIENVLG